MGSSSHLSSVTTVARAKLSIEHDDLGFEERERGSHHNFSKAGVEAKINLQRDKSNAKAYQVRQVRAALVDNNLVPQAQEEL